MTVSATPRKAGPFAGTGAQTAFPFTFKIFATTDVVVNTVVTATGALATPVNGVDYTVAMNADQETAPGGTVNMLAAPAVGVSLVVSSAVPSTQSVAVTNNGGFFPAVFNTEFDKLTVLIQQLEEKATRTFSSSITAAGVSGLVVPVANAVLVWDGAGQNILSIPQATLAASFVYNSATYQAALATSLAAVPASMIPDGDGTRNIGSGALRWLNIFLSGLLAWGSTNAFPALKRLGTGLQVRLGDDSGDAPLSASAFTSTLAQFFLASLGSILAGADGVFQLLNNAGTGFTRLCFGGVTNAFPALKRTGTSLQVRLGDDSGDADFTAKAGTFSGQLAGNGTTTNSNAAAGQIGEHIKTSVVQGSAVALTTNTPANMGSVSLGAGDWDVWLVPWFTSLGAATYAEGSISLTSASRPTAPNDGGLVSMSVAFNGAGSVGLGTAQMRLSLSATTTVWAVGFAIFSSGTPTLFGTIQARRVR